MKKISTTFASLFLFILCSFGQNEEQRVNKSLVGVYIIPLKASYELGIGKSNTMEFSAGLSGLAKYDTDQFNYSLSPMFESSYKYYYNWFYHEFNGKPIIKDDGHLGILQEGQQKTHNSF